MTVAQNTDLCPICGIEVEKHHSQAHSVVILSNSYRRIAQGVVAFCPQCGGTKHYKYTRNQVRFTCIWRQYENAVASAANTPHAEIPMDTATLSAFSQWLSQYPDREYEYNGVVEKLTDPYKVARPSKAKAGPVAGTPAAAAGGKQSKRAQRIAAGQVVSAPQANAPQAAAPEPIVVPDPITVPDLAPPPALDVQPVGPENAPHISLASTPAEISKEAARAARRARMAGNS